MLILTATLIVILIAVRYLITEKMPESNLFIDKLTPTSSLLRKESPSENAIRCTADVKKCPDGSYIGRIPPSCSFAPCP